MQLTATEQRSNRICIVRARAVCVARIIPIRACVIESRTKIDRKHARELRIVHFLRQCVLSRAWRLLGNFSIRYLLRDTKLWCNSLRSFIRLATFFLLSTLKTCRPIREQIRRNNCIFSNSRCCFFFFWRNSVYRIFYVCKCRGSRLSRVCVCILYHFGFFLAVQPAVVCKMATCAPLRTYSNCMQKVSACNRS